MTMNMTYFIIRLASKKIIPIASPLKKLFGDSSVMTNAEQQGLITAEECDSIDWSIERIPESQYTTMRIT